MRIPSPPQHNIQENIIYFFPEYLRYQSPFQTSTIIRQKQSLDACIYFFFYSFRFFETYTPELQQSSLGVAIKINIKEQFLKSIRKNLINLRFPR